MSVSPLYIEIALHYHCCVNEFDRLDFSACRVVVADMVEQGLLHDNGPNININIHTRRYDGTDKLDAWVKALCAVPFPVQQWIIPS